MGPERTSRRRRNIVRNGQALKVSINDLRENPDNPRSISGEKFEKLVNSIRQFPEMMEARPIVVDQNNVILGGNMRFKAAKEAGLQEVDVYVASWDEAKNPEFIIKDNVGFGEWDWDMLANEWDAVDLQDWALDVWSPEPEPTMDELIAEEKKKPATMKITFDSPEQLQAAEIEIQELLDRKYPGAFFSVSAGEL